MSTRATINNTLNYSMAGVTPKEGALLGAGATNVAESWVVGTGSNQFNQAGTYKFSMGASTTQVINLQTDLNLLGAALSLVEVRAIYITNDAANQDKITIEADATNGWLGWMDTASQVVEIGIGETLCFVAPIDGSKTAVGASTRELLLTNVDSSNTSIVHVDILGVDA